MKRHCTILQWNTCICSICNNNTTSLVAQYPLRAKLSMSGYKAFELIMITFMIEYVLEVTDSCQGKSRAGANQTQRTEITPCISVCSQNTQTATVHAYGKDMEGRSVGEGGGVRTWCVGGWGGGYLPHASSLVISVHGGAIHHVHVQPPACLLEGTPCS